MSKIIMQDVESFRNHISTVSEKGKRVWIYPKKQTGKYYQLRTIVSIILLNIFVVLPFIKYNEHQFFMLNVLERKFILFGFAFGPHDFFLFVLATVIMIVFIVLFTAVYGRIFCGWFCPQTVFMEMVFRRIEYWIEGDASHQRKLNSQPLSFKKFWKKFAKHLIFLIISFIIGNIFLAYFIGRDEFFQYITSSPREHMTAFITVSVFSGIFYFIFSRFREQACTIVCPYGRLQSVLLDTNSIVVAYDYVRGEPRRKFVKNKPRIGLGDCINCNLCVAVCPTGIDIRNGTQLECVNCTACIDACDSVMEKVNLPKGLIKYSSLNAIRNKVHFRITPRIVIYSILLLILIGAFVSLLFTRKSIDVTVLRTPGKIYQEFPGDKISNVYTLKIVNNTFDSIYINLKSSNIDAEIKMIGNTFVVPPISALESQFLILIDRDKIQTPIIHLPVEVYSTKDDKIINLQNTSFISPVKQ
ncbi:MAG: cytochrome c oxidase accessory protein CcoG [Ignavibacteria bacterium]